MAPPPARVRLAAGPLLAAVHARGGINHLAPRGPLRRAYFRAQHTGQITVWAADQLAIGLLEVHPAVIWGDDWWVAITPTDTPHDAGRRPRSSSRALGPS